jgi:hypothetical protein
MVIKSIEALIQYVILERLLVMAGRQHLGHKIPNWLVHIYQFLHHDYVD